MAPNDIFDSRNGDALNGQAVAARLGNRTHSFSVLDKHMSKYRDSTEDPYVDVTGAPPNLGRVVLPHVQTFQGLFGSYSRAYRTSDEALKHSRENARFMRNDVGIMECVESRSRSTALLDWELVPEDENSEDQRDLCQKIERIMRRIRRFTEYRMNLLHAIWNGRYGIQHRWGWETIGGKQYVMPSAKRDNPGWLPVNGDKIIFRYDDGTVYTPAQGSLSVPDQVGILVGARHQARQRIGHRWTVEPTGRGLAYFLTDWERELLVIHKHSIEDGPWEDAIDAGVIHGVGVRSRIYWDWFQKQEMLAFLVSYLERSAGGIEIWSYPAGSDAALTAVKKASRERLADGKNVVFFPRPLGEDGAMYDVQIVEPGLGGIDILQNLLTEYFGHRIKRYILGQTLSSEASATGLGSGVADLHLDTLLQIIKYDATNLEETITWELVERIKRYNFPRSSGVHIAFRIKTEAPDVEKKLESFSRAYEMGASLKEDEVMDLIGAGIPTGDDRVLKQPDPNEGMPGMEGGQPGMEGQPPDPQAVQQQFAFNKNEISSTVMEKLFGDPKKLEDTEVAYVAEGKDNWTQRDVPNSDFDTGNRHRTV